MKRIFLKTISLFLLVFMAGYLISCEKDADIKKYVYPAPEVTSFYPESGYANTEVTIFGQNFGSSVKDKDGNPIQAAKVYFGGVQAEEILSCKDNCIVVKVPEKAVSGDIELKVWEYEITVGHYTIVPLPTIASIQSENQEFGSSIAFAGDGVVITGTGFGTDKAKVSVDFNGSPAEIISLSDTEIRTVAPLGYTSGNVSVTVKGYTLVAGAMRNPESKGDVTAFYLKNYMNPESVELTSGQAGTRPTTGIPKNWIYTPNMLNKKNEGGTEMVGLVSLTDRVFAVSAGWGVDPEPSDETTPSDNYIKNGKMYQRTTLPAGSYTLQMDVTGHGHSDSQLYLVVSKSDNGFPDYNNITSNASVINYVPDDVYFADANTAYVLSMDFSLEEETEVFIGIALNFKPNIWYNFKGFRLILN